MREVNQTLLDAYLAKVERDTSLLEAFQAYKRGDTNHTLSTIASQCEHCDDAMQTLWEAVKQEMSKS